MTPEQKRSMLYDFRDRIMSATDGLFAFQTDEDALLRIGRELNALDPSLVAELDKMMGGTSLKEYLISELPVAGLSNEDFKKKVLNVRDAFYPSMAAKPAPASDSPTLDAPATETLDEISVEEPAPQQDAQQNQVSMEEPANRLAASQAPILQTDPKTTGPGDITRRNMERELAAEGAADVRNDIFNERRQRRIDGISDSLEADIAESWATSPTGRRDGRKWSELDPETKNEMRGRFMDYRESMATPSMDDPGLRGPQGPQGPQGPSGMPPGVVDMDKEYGRYKNPAGLIVESRMPLEVMRQYREDRARNPLAAQNYLNSINPVTKEREARMNELLDAREARQNQGAPASPQPSTVQPYDSSFGLNSLNPKPVLSPTDFADEMTKPRPEFNPNSLPTVTETNTPNLDDIRPMQGPQPLDPMQGPPTNDDMLADLYIKKEMEKSKPRTSPTVPNPNYDYSTRNNKPSPQFVPVYGKGGYTGYTEGKGGRFVQAPKGFDQKRHLDSINFMAPETKKQQQMERQARRGAMKNPFTFVDTDRDEDNFLNEYQYNRARDEKRKYKGTFNPYA